MRDYFCGWYFKCQSDTQTLAVIPALHRSEGERSCSVQLITDEGAWNFAFPYDQYRGHRGDCSLSVGENRFAPDGVSLHLRSADCMAEGTVRFGSLTPIRYDIMGPFRYVPFMECRHSVVSMRHSVEGELCVNGVRYGFHDAVGYIEGDRGHSFPKEYAWTQCCFEDGSLMLSVADIPLGHLHFTGVIGVIRLQGREYRLATYLGARAIRIGDGEVEVVQGDMSLSVRLIEKSPHSLRAPSNGVMSRTIHESAACRAAYHFSKGTHTLLAFESSMASFEYEYAH